MKYLTQILGKRAYWPSGDFAGKVTDVVATHSDRLPALHALVVRHRKAEIYVPYDLVEFDDDPAGPKGVGNLMSDIRLKVAREELPPYKPPQHALHLRQDVLDKQIVDVHDFRVVRANDVRLAEVSGSYCVVGVDASLRAMLRRLDWSVSKPIEALAKFCHIPLRVNLIAWDDVQTLEPGSEGGRIRLKVSHDKIARLHPADIADIVSQLSPQHRAEALGALGAETVADALAEAEPAVQAQIMQQLDDETVSEILNQMEPDDAADVLEDMPAERTNELLERMDPVEAEAIHRLLAYHADTAGGLMTPEYVSVDAFLTCEETIQRLRELSPKAEMIYYVYVTDEENRLVGVLSLRDLVISPADTPIHDIMVRNVRHVYVEDHADEVAKVISRYSLLAVPVVDGDEKLLGIITVDDALERLIPPERRRRLPLPSLQDSEEI